MPPKCIFRILTTFFYHIWNTRFKDLALARTTNLNTVFNQAMAKMSPRQDNRNKNHDTSPKCWASLKTVHIPIQVRVCGMFKNKADPQSLHHAIHSTLRSSARHHRYLKTGKKLIEWAAVQTPLDPSLPFPNVWRGLHSSTSNFDHIPDFHKKHLQLYFYN